jgi:hypothetical protein
LAFSDWRSKLFESGVGLWIDAKPERTLDQQQAHVTPPELSATVLLKVVEACLHSSTSERIFLRELRVGIKFPGNAAQRLDLPKELKWFGMLRVQVLIMQ